MSVRTVRDTAQPRAFMVRAGGLVTAMTLALLAGCTAPAYQDTPLPSPTPPSESTPTPGPAAPECDDALASYAPMSPLPEPGDMPSGSTMATIEARGRLIVGVSSDSLLLGARNPISGQIEGFDIDMARLVADAIFGDPDAIELKVITSAERITVLQEGTVDIVARNMTITCSRWEEIAFSAEYYRAGQRLLVPLDSFATSLNDLAGMKVCAPTGSTSLERLDDYPDVIPVPAATHTGCLVKYQQGEVDAITGDDTVLAGLAAQDPYAQVVGMAFSEEPYGLGMNKDQVDLVRFVNGVLAQAMANGEWAQSYDTWLAGDLGSAPIPVVPDYGRG